MAQQLELIVRAVVQKALDDCPALVPQDRRYADYEGQRLAKEQAAAAIAHAMSANGFLPPDDRLNHGSPNFSAVAYTMKNMRARLLRNLRVDPYDMHSERDAMNSIASAFFSDLEEQGWRLVRTHLPKADHSTPS